MLQKRTESRLAVFDPRVALQNITATDSTLKYPAVKSLGLAYTPFGAFAPLFKRLGSRFSPKNSPFQRRVEKVGLGPITASLLQLENAVPPPCSVHRQSRNLRL